MRATWASCAALLTLGLGTVLSGSMAFAQTNANQAKLRNEAKISMHQAEITALNKEPGSIKSKELEKEHGRLIYSFDIRTKQGIHEVNVDANTGAVVEDSVESKAAEQQERKQETHQH